MKLSTQIISSTPVFYFLDAIDFIAKKVWAEGESGSVSIIMDLNDIYPYFEDQYNPTEYELPFEVPNLVDKFILLTGGNIPLRNINKFKFKLHRMIGIIQINSKGDGYKIVWGFKDGTKPTSYLNNHLLIHNNAIAKDSDHRVLIHCHPTNIVQKTYSDNLVNQYQFTYELWNAMPTLADLLPEGLGLIPKYENNKKTIGHYASTLINDFKMIVLKYHGVFVEGKNFDEVLNYLEVSDKAASNAMKVSNVGEYAIHPDFFKKRGEEKTIEYNKKVLNFGLKPKNVASPIEDFEEFDDNLVELLDDSSIQAGQ